MKMNKYSIIVRPIVTEKSNIENKSYDKVILKVNPKANKIEIKEAVTELLNLKVKKVATMNMHGKLKRLGRNEGRRSDWKKAVVTLEKGQTVDFM